MINISSKIKQFKHIIFRGLNRGVNTFNNWVFNRCNDFFCDKPRDNRFSTSHSQPGPSDGITTVEWDLKQDYLDIIARDFKAGYEIFLPSPFKNFLNRLHLDLFIFLFTDARETEEAGLASVPFQRIGRDFGEKIKVITFSPSLKFTSTYPSLVDRLGLLMKKLFMMASAIQLKADHGSEQYTYYLLNDTQGNPEFHDSVFGLAKVNIKSAISFPKRI